MTSVSSARPTGSGASRPRERARARCSDRPTTPRPPTCATRRRADRLGHVGRRHEHLGDRIRLGRAEPHAAPQVARDLGDERRCGDRRALVAGEGLRPTPGAAGAAASSVATYASAWAASCSRSSAGGVERAVLARRARGPARARSRRGARSPRPPRAPARASSLAGRAPTPWTRRACPSANAVLSATRLMRSVARSAILPSIIVAPQALALGLEERLRLDHRALDDGRVDREDLDARSRSARGCPSTCRESRSSGRCSASRRHSSRAAFFSASDFSLVG